MLFLLSLNYWNQFDRGSDLILQHTDPSVSPQQWQAGVRGEAPLPLSLRSSQPHVADRQLLEYSRADTAISYMIRANAWIRSASARRRSLAEALNTGSSARSAEVLGLILILFTFDLFVAYEAPKANRNPFTVYIAALNQQLCKMKQDGEHRQKSKTNPRWGSDLSPKVGPGPGMGSQVHDGGHACVWRRMEHATLLIKL